MAFNLQYSSMINFSFQTPAMRLPYMVLGLIFTVCIWLMAAGPGSAQSTADIAIPAPSFSSQFLLDQKQQVTDNPNLSDEQKTTAHASLDRARAALENAKSALENAVRLQSEIDNTPQILDRLRSDILEAQSQITNDQSSEAAILTGETLLKLRQDLIVQEGELRRLRVEVENYESTLQTLLSRPLREDLADARTRLAEISEDLENIGEIADLEPTARAGRYVLEAQQYYRRSQIAALERDIAGLSGRQQILNLRRDLAQFKAQQAERNVIRLQNQTGQRRLSEANAIQSNTVQMLSALENSHPFLIDYSARNVAISNRLIDIAMGASSYPRLQADTRARSDSVKSDLDVARQLTELGAINRQSSATLRRLRNQRPSVNVIKSEIESTRKAILTATQDRLWAQEQLREVPIGQFDADALSQSWRETTGGQPLGDMDKAGLQALYSARRDLLLEMSDAAFARITESDELLTLQIDLMDHANDLRTLLDQKLLWLPSVSAIDLNWPQRAFRGFVDVFSVGNFNTAWSVLKTQAARYLLVLLVGIIAVLGILLTRRQLRDAIRESAKHVGRVQKDTYWHTPKAALGSAIIAAPIPLMLLLIGFLFQSSPSGEPIIQSLGQTGIELSGFTMFFMMWRDWNRDKFLLAAHFGLPRIIRHNLIKQLNWFIPFAGVTIALVTLTQNSREPDIYEGFSVLAFIVTAIALSYFSYKILWYRWPEFQKALANKDLVWRHRRSITLIIVGLPLLAAVLAATGYYDTARELLSRLFFSAGLVVGTYITYGIIRRTVLVAQRRLALRQAIERREKNLKARQEKEEAEERGDTPPPPVNYEEIDLETLSRQSAQLLSTFVILGFALLMWAFWQDLLPALSIFDDVRLWPHMVTTGDGVQIEEWVSLWNIIQALAIVVVTFLAAKNLPGFLEVFILNRSRFDAGTRYAIVSVLGYAIIAVGIVVAFNKLGTEWSQFQWIIAALGVGIGFGLQEIIANFISGLIILFERPVRLGDYVTIGDQSGTITRIQIRATTLADLDNREILIPNKELITGRVTNWTLSNSTTRMIIRVGVAYGTNTDEARQVILKAVSAEPKVLEAPKPQVFFLGFGDSSLDYEIRVFLRSFEDRFPVSHAIHTAVYKALEEAKISIPFPQRDLHIITPPQPMAKDLSASIEIDEGKPA